MPITDPSPIWNSWGYDSSTLFNTITYTTSADTTIPLSQPFVAVPVTPVPPPPDDSPLAWLREQVSEVCELARAA